MLPCFRNISSDVLGEVSHTLEFIQTPARSLLADKWNINDSLVPYPTISTSSSLVAKDKN